jgi:hypothetical protein
MKKNIQKVLMIILGVVIFNTTSFGQITNQPCDRICFTNDPGAPEGWGCTYTVCVRFEYSQTGNCDDINSLVEIVPEQCHEIAQHGSFCFDVPATPANLTYCKTIVKITGSSGSSYTFATNSHKKGDIWQEGGVGCGKYIWLEEQDPCSFTFGTGF